MAQDPPGPRAHRHRRALGDFRARSIRSASSSWTRNTSTLTSRRKRRATTRATWPSCAARWKARGGRARLGHAFAGEFLQLSQRANTRCSKCPSAWTTRRCRSCASWTCGRRCAAGKGIPIFSPQLKEAITQRLERGEQTILFLNRRGYSTSLQCPQCGYVADCPNCSVSLTYHRHEQKLCCHICGHQEKVPTVCPNDECRNPAIRYAGLGTQKVEDTLGKLFPKPASSAWIPTR